MFFRPTWTIQKFLFENLSTITSNIHTLFCILVYFAMIVFDNIIEEIKKILTEVKSRKRIEWQLEMWRQNHVLACEFVDSINECFGTVLLVSIGCYFGSFIAFPYEVYLYHNQYTQDCGGPPFSVICRFMWLNIRDMVRIALLIAVPYQIRKRVSAIIVTCIIE